MSKKWASKPALGENGEPLLTKNGKKVLRKSYSVLQDNFYNAMRSAGYTDVERGERGSSEEHLTVTQFKVEKEQERLANLTVQTEQKTQEAALLEKKIEKIQEQKVDMDAVDKIEAKPKMLSSKVTLERSEYENLVTAAKKYVTSDRKESKLKKLLELANKTIAELSAKIATLTEELKKYRSVEKKLHSAGLEVENEQLRSKIRNYENAIERNNLWHIFNPKRSKTHRRSDAR